MKEQLRGIPRLVLHNKGCFNTTATLSGVLPAELLELLLEFELSLPLETTAGFCWNRNKEPA